MKRNLGYAVFLAILCAILSVPAVSQYASVKGTCKDAQGNPIPDAQVVWHNDDNGRTTNLKTNKKGEYFSLGIEAGKYTVSLSKDGKQLDQVKNFQVSSEDISLDFDLKKSQEQSVQQTAKQQGLTPEQVKQKQEEAANAEKYNANVKQVNEKLNAAKAAVQPPAPDYDKAIALLTEAVGMAPNESLVWYRRGIAYLDSAKGLTDAAEKTKRNTAAYDDLQKAIELKKGDMAKAESGGQPAKTSGQGPSDKVLMAAYYDNLGAATSRLGKIDEAASAYRQASEFDPTNGQYYFNLGAVLTNANLSNDLNKRKQAIDAFDKSIAADPNGVTIADAYFWKGQNLMGMATFNKENKMVVPDGTVEAYQKYLELKPTGNHAQEAKDMLTALNSTVETSFGGKKTANKKKD
jgi:tetratricopeptide (TPR) repeat protein